MLSLSKHEDADLRMSRNRTPRGGSHTSSRHARRELGPSQRQLRVGEMLRHALAQILNRSDIRDPDLDGISVTITQVKPSPDMRYATVYCAPLGGKNAGPIIAALNRHKGFLRGEMGHMISIKFTPDLRFVEDQSFAEAEKIENLLKSPLVQRDLVSPEESEDEADD
jgi:ribosome-binding factor A